MTEPEIWQLVLDAANKAAESSTALGERVRALEVKVDAINRGKKDAVDTHKECRDEVDEELEEIRKDHKELKGRVEKIEDLHQEELGLGRGRIEVWKVLVGAVGFVYVVVSITAIILKW